MVFKPVRARSDGARLGAGAAVERAGQGFFGAEAERGCPNSQFCHGVCCQSAFATFVAPVRRLRSHIPEAFTRNRISASALCSQGIDCDKDEKKAFEWYALATAALCIAVRCARTPPAGTWLAPATSAPGLGTPVPDPHLYQNWHHLCHTATGLQLK